MLNLNQIEDSGPKMVFLRVHPAPSFLPVSLSHSHSAHSKLFGGVFSVSFAADNSLEQQSHSWLRGLGWLVPTAAHITPSRASAFAVKSLLQNCKRTAHLSPDQPAQKLRHFRSSSSEVEHLGWIWCRGCNGSLTVTLSDKRAVQNHGNGLRRHPFIFKLDGD